MDLYVESLATSAIESSGAVESSSAVEYLSLRDGNRTLFIPLRDIQWVAAAGNYVEIHTARKTLLVRHTVKAMEAKLDSNRFLRVRPSAIVNVAVVQGLESRAGGDYIVTLRDGTQIPSSRSFRERIERVLGKPPRSRRH